MVVVAVVGLAVLIVELATGRVPCHGATHGAPRPHGALGRRARRIRDCHGDCGGSQRPAFEHGHDGGPGRSRARAPGDGRAHAPWPRGVCSALPSCRGCGGPCRVQRVLAAASSTGRAAPVAAHRRRAESRRTPGRAVLVDLGYFATRPEPPVYRTTYSGVIGLLERTGSLLNRQSALW